ncbi:hypothetical protein PINS_up001057 [Pythium insidiosum]|nr:hypothetical protein PINS_up001057 [Pythium insidiosum]
MSPIAADAQSTAPTTPVRSVQVPPWGFRLGWAAILTLHGLCAFYFALNAHVYNKTPGSSLGVGLVAYNIGMPMENYRTLKIVHAVFAALHILLGGVMIVWSIWKRRFSFGPLQELTLDVPRNNRASKVIANDSHAAASGISQRFSSITMAVSRGVTESGRLSSFVSTGSRAVQLVASLFSRQGFFGVESPHFEEILAVREIVESVLQAYQAYRMSQLLARPWLNRFYVGMLVVNCWMVPIVHFVCRRNTMLRRALSLLCDAVLDFTSAMAVPTVLLFSYYADFDTSNWGFPYTMWYDDTWCVRVMTEFQIMLVASWGDLASRCVFSFGLISCIESTKELLREAPTHGPTLTAHSKLPPAAPTSSEPHKPGPQIASRRGDTRIRVVSSFRQLQSTPLRRILQTFQAVCAVLGAFLVVLHLYAESVQPLEQCVIQVHPWLERRPACIFLKWDCEAQQPNGQSMNIQTQWAKSSAEYVRRMLVLHCPHFEMPELISSFHALVGIKMYNTTIAAWNEAGALTATHHPWMILAYFVRVNMSSSGELPPGLLAQSFPPMLWDIEITTSNLRKLPDDVDTKWPQEMYFTCEVCEFREVPSALHRMSPYWVEFGRNPFTVFPFEVFAIEGLQHFSLSGTPLPSLAPPTLDETAVQGTTLRYLYLPGTNVTWLPHWLDTFATLPRDIWYLSAVDLSFTPICDAIGQMRAGTIDRFPVEWTATVPPEQVSIYMSITPGNVSMLDGVITCDSLQIGAYPLAEDDAMYQL